MNNILFIDTETTGFKKSGLIQEGQARVCQVAMIMTDQEERELARFSSLVKPDGWIISDGARNCHGISQTDCIRYGLPQTYFVNIFLELSKQCEKIVAHNEQFDRSMMEIEMAYYDEGLSHHGGEWYCTQKNSTKLCKIPPTKRMKDAGRTHFKSPTLTEALKILTGKKLINAHDAMADTTACRDIYFAIQEQNVLQNDIPYGNM